MKNYKLLFLFILFPFLLHAQVNRGLLVFIDKYPLYSDWEDLHSTNDSAIIIPMLLKQGFNKKNLQILSNSRAVKKSIIQALNNLYKLSGKGDYLYIHFSCHGQQMADNDGDEADGLDEALIPFDAPMRYTKGKYEGENHIRDDEFREHLESLRAKVGPTGNITVVLDACHSGTGTRIEDEEEYIRGTSYIFAPEGFVAKRGLASNRFLSHKTGKNLSPLTVFTACQDSEENREYLEMNTGKRYGSLSYALCKTLSRSLKKSISPSQFYLMLKKEMEVMLKNKKGTQTPYFETTNNEMIFRLGK